MNCNHFFPLREEILQHVTNNPPFYEMTQPALRHRPKHHGMKIFTFEGDNTIYIDAVCPYTREYISLIPELIEAQKSVPYNGVVYPFPWDDADIVMLYHGKTYIDAAMRDKLPNGRYMKVFYADDNFEWFELLPKPLQDYICLVSSLRYLFETDYSDSPFSQIIAAWERYCWNNSALKPIRNEIMFRQFVYDMMEMRAMLIELGDAALPDEDEFEEAYERHPFCEWCRDASLSRIWEAAVIMTL